MPGLRTGFTTGTCAAAAAKAAAIWLVHREHVSRVEIALPTGRRVELPVEWDALGRAYVEKDAGDDPDCTHGAHVTVSLTPLAEAQLRFVAGEGVGTVTRPGLGLEVGEPAINPVPRRQITDAIREVTDEGFAVVVSVPGGEAMAERTTNARLGIVGGISILGTTGIVRPFSTASYRASVVQQIDVAAAAGLGEMVLATGSRTEARAMAERSDLDPVGIVEVGDFTGVAVRRAAHHHMDPITWYAMVGKVTKVAQGLIMTHFHRADVDTSVLREAAIAAGAPAAVVEAADATNTARHFYEVCRELGVVAPLELLAERAAVTLSEAIGGRATVEVVLCDVDDAAVVVRRSVPGER
ncbi:cobalamin biosynthesis protein CbiD [Acidimicrobium ferrooxidans DSM 10331]|uniref:Cobalt-precorrin-5B C(1)-methyltransferase n=1 Tax=Acidimicrobium ferrooxidans (strain DSM 10331 / JCM 15462 / NBRC 103882 / ICP) TaxID=525909 RepID=C7LYE6_ACIFD|nr:cobalt-precorrin-5B (C(1))-methyltransferase [Acidimicrobium ferrooxidans]ACU53754.1 cobalamin biosynthesis protein CbiD [Acidimicrobium ferrooxidans DSM 10331]